jgi:hypothetical protein
MGAVLTWFVNSRAGRFVATALGFLTALLLFYLKAFSDGKKNARIEQQNDSIENLRKRAETDETIDVLSDNTRRHHLRDWVSDK